MKGIGHCRKGRQTYEQEKCAQNKVEQRQGLQVTAYAEKIFVEVRGQLESDYENEAWSNSSDPSLLCC